MLCGNLPAFYVIFSDKWPLGRQTDREVSKVCGNMDCWRTFSGRQKVTVKTLSVVLDIPTPTCPPGCLWGPPSQGQASWFHKTDAPDKPEKGGHRDVNDKGEDEDKYRQIQDKYKKIKTTGHYLYMRRLMVKDTNGVFGVRRKTIQIMLKGQNSDNKYGWDES